MTRAALFLLLSLGVSLACVELSVKPLGSVKPLEPVEVAFQLRSKCSGVVELTVRVSNATISGVNGFDSVVSNVLVLKREITPNEVFTAYVTLVPLSEVVPVHFTIYLNGRSYEDEEIYLGTPPCVEVLASSVKLEDSLLNFKVPKGARLLDVIVLNSCKRPVSLPLNVKFPLGKALAFVPYYKCDRYETVAYVVKSCARDGLGTPIRICVKSSPTGPFKTIYVKENPSAVVRECTGCVKVPSRNGEAYVCSKCWTEVKGPKVIEEIEARAPRCFEWRCAKWNEEVRTLEICKEWSGDAINSTVREVGNSFLIDLVLGKGELKELLIPYVFDSRFYLIGSFSEQIKVPAAILSYGNSEVTVYEAVTNYGYGITILLTVIALLALSYFVMRIVGG